jgi:hypothetical protein
MRLGIASLLPCWAGFAIDPMEYFLTSWNTFKNNDRTVTL